MKNLLKAATRKVLAVADLKLGRLSSFQAITRELETTRAELETTRELLAPTALSHSHPKQTTPSPKQPPITQIFISDTETPPSGLLQNCVQSVKRCFPGSEHKIYGNQEIEEFIKKHYDRKLLDCYRRLKPYAYKADLARYCILHEIGGWYFDIGMKATGTQVNLPDEINLIAFREINKYTFTNYACDNCIIFAKPKTQALDNAIEMIVENTKNQFYGVTPLCPTGPSLWGKAIAKSGVDKSIVFGDSVELTPGHHKKNKAMVLPDGSILALKKQAEGGDLSALGAKGTNNYNEFWHQKRVYLN